MIHRPSQGASQRLEPRPEPVSSSGDEQRCYTTARDTIHRSTRNLAPTLHPPQSVLAGWPQAKAPVSPEPGPSLHGSRGRASCRDSRQRRKDSARGLTGRSRPIRGAVAATVPPLFARIRLNNVGLGKLVRDPAPCVTGGPGEGTPARKQTSRSQPQRGIGRIS